MIKNELRGRPSGIAALNRALDGWERSLNEQPAHAGRGVEILRTDGLGSTDFVAVDHRDPAAGCRFELFGAGRSWMGPDWKPCVAGLAGRTAVRLRVTDTGGELGEWSYRAGDARVIYSVLLLRKRGLALLSVTVDSPAVMATTPGFRVSVAPGVVAAPIRQSRAVELVMPRARGSAQVLPIGLPALPYVTERGAFVADDREHSLVLSQTSVGRRCWLPLLVSWDGRRHRRRLHWRVLTVSEKSRAVTADRAFAARVSWGRTESYVVYRSLTPPRPRSFLGHHTNARFLFGLFTPDGTVTPIMKID
jgi:hypothetical protein